MLLALSPRLCLSRVCLVSSLLVQVHLRQVQPSTVKQPWQVQLGAGTAYCIQLGFVAIQAANSLPKLSTREGNKSWSPFLHVIYIFLT